MLVDRGKRGVEVVELDHHVVPCLAAQAVAQLRLVGRADRRHRPPVEGVREGDEVVLPGLPLA